MNAKELALVAFWDLDPTKDQMVCKCYFMIPNPMKRMIKTADGTNMYQVLYVSQHTKDVFFFFKGYKIDGGDDLENTRKNEYRTQCAFINLDT